MNTAKPLTIATRNAHKTQEIAAILPADKFHVESLAAHPNAPEIEENGSSFAANAALKAVGISRVLPGLVLADDSGLCVDVLDGAPGIHSARFAGEHGNDTANNQKLIAELCAHPDAAPYTARFVCAMCLAEGGHIIAQFEGVCEGRIEPVLRGEGGFGYDPLFIPAGHSETFATLAAEEKNNISHRAHALEALQTYLKG